jgi:hypothetical protein
VPHLETRSLRRVRLTAAAPRLAAGALVLILAVAGLRAAIAPPPQPAAATVIRAAPPASDGAVEAFAEGFAREYLTWRAGDDDERAARLRPYLGETLDGDGGLQPARGSTQRVLWTAVAGSRRTQRGFDVVVAAETTNGRVHLSVPVVRDRRGFLGIADFPALVGPPPTDPVDAAKRPATRSVDDTALVIVVERAARNYLAGNRDNLLADLTPDAVVSLPERRLRVTDVQDVTWLEPSTTVGLELQAQDAAGDTWTLRYALSVRRSDRWYVRSIHLDPQ